MKEETFISLGAEPNGDDCSNQNNESADTIHKTQALL